MPKGAEKNGPIEILPCFWMEAFSSSSFGKQATRSVRLNTPDTSPPWQWNKLPILLASGITRSLKKYSPEIRTSWVFYTFQERHRKPSSAYYGFCRSRLLQAPWFKIVFQKKTVTNKLAVGAQLQIFPKSLKASSGAPTLHSLHEKALTRSN